MFNSAMGNILEIAPNNRLDVIINNCKYYGYEYTIKECGNTKTIITPMREVTFYSEYIKGSHLFKNFFKDVKNFIQSSKFKPYVSRYYFTQLMKLDNLLPGMEYSYIDIDDCYWDTAYKVGCISQKTWITGLKDPEWKIARNSCIGYLKSKIYTNTYKDDLVIHSFVEDFLIGGESLNNHIINTVWDMFENIIYNILKDDFALFNVDSVYFLENKSNFKQVRDYIKKCGYGYKHGQYECMKFEDNTAYIQEVTGAYMYRFLLESGHSPEEAFAKTKHIKQYYLYSKNNLYENYRR